MAQYIVKRFAYSRTGRYIGLGKRSYGTLDSLQDAIVLARDLALAAGVAHLVVEEHQHALKTVYRTDTDREFEAERIKAQYALMRSTTPR